MPPLIEITRLSVDFPGQLVPAVREVTFEIQPGEALGLLGPSGSGKSTLAWSLMNLHVSQVELKGVVWFEGRNLLTLRESEIRTVRGRHLALISQEPAAALHPMLRIGDQLRDVFNAHYKTTSKACEYRIREMLSDVGLPATERILRARPHQLSGGECQRAAIAQALICSPRLLIADEPTSALDTQLEKDVLLLLSELMDRRRMALLLITHNPSVLSGLVDRVMVMNEGQIVESGPIDAVYAAPRHPFTRDVLRAWRSRQTQPAGISPGPLLLMATGLVKRHTQRAGLTSSPIKITALDGVEFSVSQGEVVAVVGASGSGKSTLGRCLAGIEKPTRGTIRNHCGDRQDVQYVFPDALAAMNPKHTVSEIISEPLYLRDTNGSQGTTARQNLTVSELLSMVGLAPAFAKRRPSELSGGQRQRVGIARALAAQPRVLILDESLSGLDLPVQAQLVSLLLEQRRVSGMALVFILHDLRLAESIADRIVELRDGRIVSSDALIDDLAVDEVHGMRAS